MVLLDVFKFTKQTESDNIYVERGNVKKETVAFFFHGLINLNF